MNANYKKLLSTAVKFKNKYGFEKEAQIEMKQTGDFKPVLESKKQQVIDFLDKYYANVNKVGMQKGPNQYGNEVEVQCKLSSDILQGIMKVLAGDKNPVTFDKYGQYLELSYS